MALTEEKRPYELLARWDTQTGQLKGAHVVFATVMLRDGAFASETLDAAQAVDIGQGSGFPLADILGQLQTDALAKVAEQETTITAKDVEIAALQTQLTQSQSDAAAKDAQIAALNEQITALTPQPPTDPAAALEAVVDAYVDRVAQSFGYDSALSFATYTSSSNDLWRRQAERFVAWRDAVWEACIAIQADVLAGKRAIPTADELIAELPQPSIPTA